MSTYERNTAATIHDALRLAESVLTSRLPLRKVGEDGHSVTLEGGDGRVKISARPGYNGAGRDGSAANFTAGSGCAVLHVPFALPAGGCGGQISGTCLA